MTFSPDVQRLNPGVKAPKTPSRSKYRNRKTMAMGKLFDSKKEAERYLQLLELEQERKIFDLKTQVPYDIDISGIHITRYIADFTYMTNDGTFVIEDVKGFRTDVYKIKRKLVRAIYGVVIRET